MSQTQSNSPAIEVEDLTVSYGPVPALLDISLAIEEGKLVGIIGPNGSGCLLYTSPSPRDQRGSRMPSSA